MPEENITTWMASGQCYTCLGFTKSLAGRKVLRDYRGAHVKRTVVAAIECISAGGMYLQPLIIWPATTHRGNCTMFAMLDWHYEFSE